MSEYITNIIYIDIRTRIIRVGYIVSCICDNMVHCCKYAHMFELKTLRLNDK